MTTLPDHPQRLLDAYRFVSGAMTSEEAARFEEALSCEQSAREAVADVVLLERSLLVERPLRTDPPRPMLNRGGKRSVLLAFAGSLLAVVVVIVLMVDRSREPLPAVAEPRTAPAGDATHEEVSAAALWAFISTAEEGIPETDEAEEPDPGIDWLEIPDWMYAAVEAGGVPEEHPELREMLENEETL